MQVIWFTLLYDLHGYVVYMVGRLIKLLLSVQVITHGVIWITPKIPLLLVGNGLCSKTQPPYSPADVVTRAQGLISSLTV